MFSPQFFDVFSLNVLLALCAMALMLLPAMAATGAGSVAMLTAFTGRKESRVFSDKLAKQLSEFGVVVLGACLLLISARWGLWFGDVWPASPPWQRFYRLFFDVPGQSALLGVLTSIIFARVWKRRKKSSTLHYVLGGFSSLVWAVTLMFFVLGWYGGMPAIGGDAGPGSRLGEVSARMELWSLPAVLGQITPWLIWTQGVFLALASAGGLGLLYLMIRRNAEDYGRDYYAWAVRRCAWWAVACAGGHVLVGVGLYVRQQLLRTDAGDGATRMELDQLTTALLGHSAMPAMLLYVSLTLAACLSLIPLFRSQTPLRYKGLIVVHVVLVLLSMAFLVTGFGAMFPGQA